MAKGKFRYWLTDEGLLQIGAWARNGLTEEQIAHNIGISRQTLNVWKNRYTSISDTLKKNKAVVDIEVENALLKRALGYNYSETKTVKSEEDVIKIETVVKQVPPDTTAQIFWLKNRKPEVWRDRRDIGIEGTVDAQLTKLSDNEIDEKINKIKKQLGINDESKE